MELKKHIEFYKREIEEIQWSLEETFATPAIMLHNRGELFISRFERYDELRGTLIFSFPNDLDHLPRINEEFSCFVIRSAFNDLETIPDTTYSDLLDSLGENDITEIRLVSYYEGPDPKRIGAIFSDVDPGFLSRIEPKMKFFIGPKEPPLEYLGNLQLFSERFRNNPNEQVNPYLEVTKSIHAARLPIGLLEVQDISVFLLNEIEHNEIVLLQGPPGVGKTYLASILVATLIDKGNSILLTALTNKASVEVCEKEVLQPYLANGCISKVSLKTIEKKYHPGLMGIDCVFPEKGRAVLATYYTFSRIWSELTVPVFDYVIVEEASQSFLTTIVAAKLAGKKVIIIGDSYQIPPIVNQKKPEQVDDNIRQLINGLETFSSLLDFPYYRKVESRRLSKRAVQYTNIFYQDQLISLVETDILSAKQQFGKLAHYIHPEGGPSLILMNLSLGKIVPQAREFIISVLKGEPHKKYKIAILAPFRETIGEMQGKIMKALNNYDILIDTVDRVQGLDVDFCFFIIPKGTFDKSLQLNRFNVATSRSKIATFIIADRTIITTNIGHPLSIEYIRKLSNDFTFNI